MIRTKHLRRDAVEPSDGTRLYVGRYYPRGIRSPPPWQERDHDLGPSRGLHTAIKTGSIPWDEYRRRFLEEMSREPARSKIRRLAERSRRGEVVTLLCDHPAALAEEECHRFLLKRLIDDAT